MGLRWQAQACQNPFCHNEKGLEPCTTQSNQPGATGLGIAMRGVAEPLAQEPGFEEYLKKCLEASFS